MRLNPIGTSDSQPSDHADQTGASADQTRAFSGPSSSPAPSPETAQLLQSRLSTCAPQLSGGIKQAANRPANQRVDQAANLPTNPPATQPATQPTKQAANQSANRDATTTPSHTFGYQVEGFASGAAQATGKMVSGLWDMAKGAAALSPMSYAAEKLSDQTGLYDYHGFSTTAASAQKTVHAIVSNPGGVLKAAVEPYRSAWRAGNYGEAIGMGTVDAVSMLADGVGEAGKVGEAASAAEKVAEGASVAAKVDEVSVAGTLGKGAAAESDASAAAGVSRVTEGTEAGKPATLESTAANQAATRESTAASNPAAPESTNPLAPGAKAAAATRPANVTRHGVPRTNPADWRALRDHWDQLGYGEILSESNRNAIAKGRTPKVDDAWISVFPEDAGLKGERISMHHIGGSPVTVPLPATRHLDAHMPGGFRYNPGGPGSALPFYPPRPPRK